MEGPIISFYNVSPTSSFIEILMLHLWKKFLFARKIHLKNFHSLNYFGFHQYF